VHLAVQGVVGGRRAGGPLLACVVLLVAGRAHAGPLAVAAATPALGSLVEEIGGPDVRVTVLARPGEDPHGVVASPGFLQAAEAADLLLVNGLDLDAGWLPGVLERSGNPRIQPGAPGYLVGAAAIVPMHVPAQASTRARRGEEHPRGNPHYLLDPMNGLRVAELIRDRLAELRPERRDAFRRRYDDFRTRLGARMVGQPLAEKYGDFEKLVGLAEYGRLEQFLQSQHLAEDEAPVQLGGWLGMMAPYRGTRAVGDHDRWAYFARRFGLDVVAHLEPSPGVPPTAPRLAELIEYMLARGVRLILASSSGDTREVQLVADRAGARIAWLQGATGARDYLSMIDDDVRRVAAALGAGASPAPESGTTTTTPSPPAE
jgi:zinc/manganese transport system substrate-binding protein